MEDMELGSSFFLWNIRDVGRCVGADVLPYTKPCILEGTKAWPSVACSCSKGVGGWCHAVLCYAVLWSSKSCRLCIALGSQSSSRAVRRCTI